MLEPGLMQRSIGQMHSWAQPESLELVLPQRVVGQQLHPGDVWQRSSQRCDPGEMIFPVVKAGHDGTLKLDFYPSIVQGVEILQDNFVGLACKLGMALRICFLKVEEE